MSQKLLFVSSPVGPIGSGTVGGVSMHIGNAYRALIDQGHTVEIIAPKGSQSSLVEKVTEVEGAAQPSLQHINKSDSYPIPIDSLLANMWEVAKAKEENFDFIINFANDWLPYYLTPFFTTPLLHRLNLSSQVTVVDEIVRLTSDRFPRRVATLTHAQARTIPGLDEYYLLPVCVDIEKYQYQDRPEEVLAWAGRISPEKGLEDAAEAASNLGLTLLVMGSIEDDEYWDYVRSVYGDSIEYLGYLPTNELQNEIGRAKAFLATPKWQEASSHLAVEAQACGTPVIAYRRGGLAEVIADEQTGFLVEPDNVAELTERIKTIDAIDRYNCRALVEEYRSIEALADYYENWFREVDLAEDRLPEA